MAQIVGIKIILKKISLILIDAEKFPASQNPTKNKLEQPVVNEKITKKYIPNHFFRNSEILVL